VTDTIRWIRTRIVKNNYMSGMEFLDSDRTVLSSAILDNPDTQSENNTDVVWHEFPLYDGEVITGACGEDTLETSNFMFEIR
jgi:hypothetical protein